MKDQNKTKKQLMDKLMALRKRVAELETFEADHTRAEEVLHESEELYRSLFENMLNGFAYCQMHFDDNDRPSDFTYLSVNSSFETLTGLRNVVGKKVTEIIPGIREADPGLLEIYGRVSKTGKPERFEMFFDSLKMWFWISVYSPKRGYFVAVFDVITERKRAEEELRKSEEIFSQFMNYSPIYVFFKDENIKSIRLSKNYTEMLGRPISELLGKNMDDLFPSDLAKSMVADDKRIFKEGKQIEIEEELNGRFYSTIKFPIYRDGEPAYLAGFTVDITERKRMEEALRIKDWAIESATNAIATSDLAGNLNYVNPAFLKLWGYSSPAEVLGKPAMGFWQMGEKAAEVMEAVRNKGGWIGELVAQDKDGALFDVYVASSMVVNDAGQPVCMYASFADITEHKRAEEEKRRLEERSRKVVEDIFRFIPEGVLVFSRKMELLRQNQAFRELVSGYAKRLGFAEDDLENLIVDKIKAAMGDENIKEIRVSRKHENGEQT